MTRLRTPLDAATAVLQNPSLPSGDDERFVGFGVMGLPFASRHYLALRQFPAASFSPGYRSVWHRDPERLWTFYATTPGPQSCARFFSSATPNDTVQCDIDVAWVTPWSLFVGMPGLLEWQIDIRATSSTRLMSEVGERLPELAWTNPAVLAVLGRAAGQPAQRPNLRPDGLTPSKIEVLCLVARGASNKEIAASLVISEKTARNHVERTYAEIAVSNRIGASMYALRHGLVKNA